jgi:type IV pilus assembly protein PilM
MAAKVLGIEIGERLIKVCETNMGPGVRKVSGCVMFQTPPNAVSDGEIKDPEALASALKENLTRAGLKNKKVIFSVSSGRIATREVTIPPVNNSKIKAIVEANAADYFPVDMSNYHVTYTLQERKPTGEDAGCRLLVMAAPLPVLAGYFKLAELMSYSVQAVDYSGNSHFRFLETLNTEGVTMYVDINGTYSVTTVMKKNKLLMQRTFPSGVDDYVLAYMGGAGREEGEYLNSLRELNADGVSASGHQAGEEPDEYLARLVSNITRIADYYNSSNWDNPIDNLVFTGIGASISGLKEAAADSTGLPIAVMTKLDRVSAPVSISGSLIDFIACLGCAINPVDFIPEQYSKAKKKEAKKKNTAAFGATVFAVCVLAALALSATSYLGYMTALDEKKALEKQVADLEYTETVRNNSLMYKSFGDSLTALGEAIKSPNDELLAFIGELEQKMPPEVNILSASCGKESISMNITVLSKTAAAKTIQQLRSFESISDIVVGQITEIVDESGYILVTFSVECTYVVAAPLDTAAAVPSPESAGTEEGA